MKYGVYTIDEAMRFNTLRFLITACTAYGDVRSSRQRGHHFSVYRIADGRMEKL
jgi:hypothetical protein